MQQRRDENIKMIWWISCLFGTGGGGNQVIFNTSINLNVIY